MRIFLIFFSAAILIAFSDAQRKLNMTKPVVNLEKRPRPVWNRPPEERRKLSIFPKNNMKFVVTPKTVKNDDGAKGGLPTKRPLMRKFVMQDRNEKGTWSFAPREPLMKTKRFTVTLAPTKSSHYKTIDEMNPEESKKVQTVISNVKSELKSSKPHNISKDNLIEIVTTKYDLFESKKSHKIERNLTKEDISETIKINDTQNSQIVQMNDNKTLPTFGESLIDVRSFNDDVILEDNTTTIQNRDGHNNVNKTTESSNIKISEHLIKNRALDLNDVTYPINQNENNSLIINSEGSNNLKSGQVLQSNDLEILLEKIVNNTEQSKNNSTLDLKYNGTLLFITPNNETSIPIKAITQIDVTKPNTFYDVVSLRNEDMENTNLGADLSTVSFILNTTNDKKQAVSETNALNDEDDFSEHIADTLVMGNLESLINFIENSSVGIKNTVKHTGNDAKNNEEFKVSHDLTAEYTTSRSEVYDKTSQSTVNYTVEAEYQTQFPEEFNKTDSNGSDAHDLSLEIYESNMPLSEETSIEGDEYDSHEPTSGNLNIMMEETSNEELIDNSNSSSLEEISNTSSSHNSNYYAEERSNESLIDKSNNLPNEQISNESYSNITDEELSDDFYADKSNNLTEDIPSESSVESSNNYTGEQFSNESSSNLTAEELSNESYYVDKSNNLTGEISSNSVTDYSNNSSEQIPNESSSVIAEEISNESYLTDDTSKEITEASNNFTEELISNESTSNVAGEEMSNESYLTDDISKESIEFSNHFSGEQTSNGSFNLSGKEIANVSKESITSEEVSIDNVDVRLSEDPADSSYERSVEEIAEEALINRFKRSNNIIEEENLPTTDSGFKYMGHDVRLNQDSIYKNINA